MTLQTSPAYRLSLWVSGFILDGVFFAARTSRRAQRSPRREKIRVENKTRNLNGEPVCKNNEPHKWRKRLQNYLPIGQIHNDHHLRSINCIPMTKGAHFKSNLGKRMFNFQGDANMCAWSSIDSRAALSAFRVLCVSDDKMASALHMSKLQNELGATAEYPCHLKRGVQRMRVYASTLKIYVERRIY